MLAYSSVAHAGYMLVGSGGGRESRPGISNRRVGPLLPGHLRLQQHQRLAVAAWLARDKRTDDIDDLERPGLPLSVPGDLASSC